MYATPGPIIPHFAAESMGCPSGPLFLISRGMNQRNSWHFSRGLFRLTVLHYSAQTQSPKRWPARLGHMRVFLEEAALGQRARREKRESDYSPLAFDSVSPR